VCERERERERERVSVVLICNVYVCVFVCCAYLNFLFLLMPNTYVTTVQVHLVIHLVIHLVMLCDPPAPCVL
jgi:hypothetical protein